MTALDALGNPVPGATVALDASGAGNTLTQLAATTDASGRVTGTLSSTKAEMKTVSATLNGTVPLAQTPPDRGAPRPSVPAVSGVATFDDLSLDQLGTGYTLIASVQGIGGATSTPFNVTLLP